MNGHELLEKYPKTARIIKEWFTQKMLDSYKGTDTPEEFREQVEKMDILQNQAAFIIDNNPRVLLDIFDAYAIYINIFVTPHDKDNYDELEIYYHILPRDEKFVGDSFYSSRKEAEKAAVIDAFDLLESELIS